MSASPVTDQVRHNRMRSSHAEQLHVAIGQLRANREAPFILEEVAHVVTEIGSAQHSANGQHFPPTWEEP